MPKTSHLTLISPVRVASRPSAFDRWYTALDGLQVDVDGRTARARVLGIHSDRSDLWIQIERSGDTGPGLVLHLTPAAMIEDAIDALQRRFADRTATEIVHVTHAA